MKILPIFLLIGLVVLLPPAFAQEVILSSETDTTSMTEVTTSEPTLEAEILPEKPIVSVDGLTYFVQWREGTPYYEVSQNGNILEPYQLLIKTCPTDTGQCGPAGFSGGYFNYTHIHQHNGVFTHCFKVLDNGLESEQVCLDTTTIIEPNPSVSLTQIFTQGSVKVGETFSYTWQVTNTGNMPLDININSQIKNGNLIRDFQTDSTLCGDTYGDNSLITCNFGVLQPNEISEIITIQYTGNETGTWESIATACGREVGNNFAYCDTERYTIEIVSTDVLCGNQEFSPCIFPLEVIGDQVKVTWVQPLQVGDEPQGHQIWSTIGEPVEIGNTSFINHGKLPSGSLIPLRDGMCVTVQAQWIDVYYRTNSGTVCLESTPEPTICPDGFELVNNICVQIIIPPENDSLAEILDRLDNIETRVTNLEDLFNMIINFFKSIS